MKKNLFSFILLAALFVTNAQAQTITDANFAAAIAEACPTCITGNVLQPPAKTLTSLDVSNKNISDLTGINGFTALNSLECGSNQLTSLPGLPASLTQLGCGYNQLKTLPELPPKLNELFCTNNQLKDLPKLPETIKYLECSNNQLTSITTTLPTSLISLACFKNKLTSILTLPTSLEELYCNDNKLTGLPTIPKSLTTLYCGGNELLGLPTLPASLKVLSIGASITCVPNQITGLKITDNDSKVITIPTCAPGTPTQAITIPDTSFAAAIRAICPTCISGNVLQPPSRTLKSLDLSKKNIRNLTGINGFMSLSTLVCSENQLTLLPELPINLKELYCSKNKLNILPKLPASLIILFCDNNELKVLPELPTSLTRLSCSKNQLKSLPNLPTTLTTLDCVSNQLASLPKLPASLTYLNCQINYSLKNLPTLPPSLNRLIIDSVITCIPNQNDLTNIIINNKYSSRPTCSNAIADANFAAAIATVCPTCIAGNLLLPPVQALVVLDVSRKKISDLSGIEGFTNLTRLNCSGNLLKKLPTLPSKLTELDCSNNILTEFTNLPGLLTKINFSNNQFQTFNDNKGMPPKLPTSLTIFNCANNFLSGIGPLPASLKEFYCNGNRKLWNLSPLPASLTTFDCSFTSVKYLQMLPLSLTNLSVPDEVTCIPNQVPGLKKITTSTDYLNRTKTDITLPLCGPVPPLQPKTLDGNSKGTVDVDSLDVSISTRLSGGNAITIEYWFKGTNIQSAVRIQSPNGGDFIVAGWGGAPSHIISTDGGAANGLKINTINVNVHDNKWHHVAMTWEKGKIGGFKSYVDGVEVYQRTSANISLPILNGARPIVGAFRNNGKLSERTNGQIGRVRIWNTALTGNQILESMIRVDPYYYQETLIWESSYY